jgi:FlaA1/EpsC-like NDP-sugar epimerase
MRPSAYRRDLHQLATVAVACFPLFAASFYGAFQLRFAGEPPFWAQEVFFATLLWVIVIKLAAFFWFRVHQGWTRYLSFHDLMLLGQAVTCGALAVTLFDAMCLPRFTIPRSVIVIDWGTTLLTAGAIGTLPRLLRRDTRHFLARRGPTALIVGASDSGTTLLRALRSHPHVSYRVIGFIDDRSDLQGCRIEGVPVLGTCDDLPRLTAREHVEEVLITSGELSGAQVRTLMETGQRHGFRVKVLPSYEQLLDGRVAVHPRAVAIEDLLGRPSVEIDLDAVRDWLTGRTVMVTGSAGSIGSEICRQVLKLRPAKLVLVDRHETGQFFLERELIHLADNCGLRHPEGTRDCGLDSGNPQSARSSPAVAGNPKSVTVIDTHLADLTDRPRLEAVFRETSPEIIFHAAAYKHVPLMESHCGEAVKNIVLATRNLVDLAEAHGAQTLVMISTDKAVNPTSVMGACKRLAEQYVQARAAGSSCRLVTVRFGNVLDSSGSVVPIFREQIARGGPVTVTHPQITRYFMLIPEAAQLVIQAGAMGQGGEVFVLDMGEPVRILDLAQDMICLSGLRVGDDIEVQIIGLRPGEKLYEELYGAGEPHQQTTHPKIMVTSSAPRHLLEVTRDIARLESITDEPNDAVKSALRHVIGPQVASELSPRSAAA